MVNRIVILLVVAGSFVRLSYGACQDPAPKGTLLQQLQSTYVPTVMDPSGIKVAQPGCTLVVQLDGITANPSRLGFYNNTYEDGQVKAGHSFRNMSAIGGIAGMSTRALAVGEKVYLLRMDVKDKEIAFDVETCGTCDPAAADPTHKPFKANISFHFRKGFMAVTNLKQIEDVIGGLLAFDNGEAAAAPQQSAPPASANAPPPQAAPPVQEAAPPATPPPAFAPIAPPAPPTDQPQAPPATVGLGQTPEQVTAALGQPSTVLKPGKTKMIYVYKDLKVTFVNGKVSDIQ